MMELETVRVGSLKANSTIVSKNSIEEHLNDINQKFVPKTQKICEKTLSSDLILQADDVGALPVEKSDDGNAYQVFVDTKFQASVSVSCVVSNDTDQGKINFVGLSSLQSELMPDGTPVVTENMLIQKTYTKTEVDADITAVDNRISALTERLKTAETKIEELSTTVGKANEILGGIV